MAVYLKLNSTFARKDLVPNEVRIGGVVHMVDRSPRGKVFDWGDWKNFSAVCGAWSSSRADSYGWGEEVTCEKCLHAGPSQDEEVWL